MYLFAGDTSSSGRYSLMTSIQTGKTPDKIAPSSANMIHTCHISVQKGTSPKSATLRGEQISRYFTAFSLPMYLTNTICASAYDTNENEAAALAALFETPKCRVISIISDV